MNFKNLKLSGKVSRHILRNLVLDKAEIFHIDDHEPCYRKLNKDKCEKCASYGKSTCLNFKCLKSDALIPCSKNDEGAVLSYSSTAFVVGEIKLTRCQKLVYLYYHFCNINNEGKIHVLDELEMAKDINISLVSLRSANNYLSEQGLISVNRIGTGLIDVLIENYFFSVKYNTTIRKKIVDGIEDSKIPQGYYELSIDWFKALVQSIKSHNHLRILLFKTCKFLDNKALKINRNNLDYNTTCTLLEYKEIIKGNYSLQDIINLINEPFKLIKRKNTPLVKKTINNLFISNVNKLYDTFYLSDNYKLENVQKEFHNKFNKKILNFLLVHDSKNDYEEEVKDYELICRRYGIELVLKILNLLEASIDKKELLKDRAIIISEIKKHIYMNFINRLRKPIFNDKETFLFN